MDRPNPPRSAYESIGAKWMRAAGKRWEQEKGSTATNALMAGAGAALTGLGWSLRKAASGMKWGTSAVTQKAVDNGMLSKEVAEPLVDTVTAITGIILLGHLEQSIADSAHDEHYS